ncbi:MAG: hypothetical protein BMS9Abin23_0789 [Thermodesulfobacteriota bacterium]|nr:MAG: hypothetical protein BMS9Abin23_0789 [Thermodesulfobacteriota bacterium]
MVLIIPILIMSATAAAFSFWLYFELPGLVFFIDNVYEFCNSLLARCIDNFQIIKTGFFWFGAGLLFIGLVNATVRAVSGLIRTRRMIRRLPLKHEDKPLVLIDSEHVKTAFTHGLLKPRIYISKGLLTALDRSELKGVFLHELHHKRSRDPLRFFLAAIVRDVFFFVPAFKHFEKNFRLVKEQDADRSSASHMKEPVSLAKALLKVAGYHSRTAPVSFSRDSGMIETRVRGLIEGVNAQATLPGLKTLLSSLVILALLLLSLSAPLKASALTVEECPKKNCSVDTEKAGSPCRVHCEKSEV